MSTPISSRDISVGPHRLRLHESGSKDLTPVLWLHGSGPGVDAMANWEGLLGNLSGTFYNVAPDILGFGESSCPDPFPRGVQASVDFRVHNTIELLDALELDAVHVVGNSMGGMMALRMAQLAPERLKKIVLMGSGGVGPLMPEALARFGRFMGEPSVEAMSELLKLFVYDANAFGVDMNELAAQRMKLALRPDIARIQAATYDFSAPMLIFKPEELASIKHEVMVIHGREDAVVSMEASHVLSQHMPNAQLHIFPRAGHWAQLEQPARFKALIETFLTDLL